MNEIEWYKPSAPRNHNWCFVKVNGIMYWLKHIKVIRCYGHAVTEIKEKEAATLQDYKELKQHTLKLTSRLYQELMK